MKPLLVTLLSFALLAGGWIAYAIHDFLGNSVDESPPVLDTHNVQLNTQCTGWWIGNVEAADRNWEVHLSALQTSWF